MVEERSRPIPKEKRWVTAINYHSGSFYIEIKALGYRGVSNYPPAKPIKQIPAEVITNSALKNWREILDNPCQKINQIIPPAREIILVIINEDDVEKTREKEFKKVAKRIESKKDHNIIIKKVEWCNDIDAFNNWLHKGERRRYEWSLLIVGRFVRNKKRGSGDFSQTVGYKIFQHYRDMMKKIENSGCLMNFVRTFIQCPPLRVIHMEWDNTRTSSVYPRTEKYFIGTSTESLIKKLGQIN